MIEINWNPTARLLRQFSWMLAGVLALAAAWLAWHGDVSAAEACLGVLAVVVALVGWLAPLAMRPIYVGWMCAAWPIGWLVSHLLLAVVFFLVITPLGLILRVLGHDLLSRRWNNSAESYWEPHQSPRDSRRYFRQF
jgi:hypothetical protein